MNPSTRLTHASDDASRLATRAETWRSQMANWALSQLEDDLLVLRYIPAAAGISYQARAVIATSYIDAVAERLQRIGVE